MAYRGNVFRWEVYRADLEPHVGREQAGEGRPVLVISNDAFNASGLDVFAVLPLTKLEGKTRKAYPFEVALPRGALSEGITSIVMPHQIRTISRYRLLERMGRIDDPVLRKAIEDRLLEHLGIELTYPG